MECFVYTKQQKLDQNRCSFVRDDYDDSMLKEM